MFTKIIGSGEDKDDANKEFGSGEDKSVVDKVDGSGEGLFLPNRSFEFLLFLNLGSEEDMGGGDKEVEFVEGVFG